MRMKDLAQNWDVRDPGDFAQLDRSVRVEEPGDTKALAVFQFNSRFSATSGYGGDREARDDNCVAVIESTDLGRYLQQNRIIRLDGTSKVELYTVGAELDGNGPCAS